jgi:class 3 adenylate cyclase
MKLNIQTKLFLFLTSITAIILIGVLYAVTITISDKIEQKIIDDFNQTQAYFQRQQTLIYDRLVESCYLIGENSTFKANVEVEDPATVYEAILEFSNFARVDLFIVTDEFGKVLARFDQPDNYGDDLTYRTSVLNALNGIEPELEPEWAELWAVGDDLYQVASIPLYYNDVRIIGSISLGTRVTNIEASALKGESNMNISMFLSGNLIATSFSDSLAIEDQHSLNAFAHLNKSTCDSVLTNLNPSSAFSTNLFNEEIYAFISPIGIGEPAYFIATVPKAVELRILRALQNNIILIALISVIITIFLAFFFGRSFSRPILRLVNGMNKIKEGDLSVSVEPSTNDEIGLLTQTFNEMIVGLRERLHLMKYVGSHTIDMVKESSGGDVSLGGDRKELAVLFSDVRGFTAYSENRSPEDVIKMLNRYLGYQAELVTKFGGSVDKFVGDEMVALFFGDDAIERSLDCAIEIQKLVKKEHETDPAPVYIGIGINHGPVILGNMGATERMDYTVIGATVNLGARLCSAAEPGQILILRDLIPMVRMKYKIGRSQMMSFKGFSNEKEVVEVLSE